MLTRICELVAIDFKHIIAITIDKNYGKIQYYLSSGERIETRIEPIEGDNNPTKHALDAAIKGINEAPGTYCL